MEEQNINVNFAQPDEEFNNLLENDAKSLTERWISFEIAKNIVKNCWSVASLLVIADSNFGDIEEKKRKEMIKEYYSLLFSECAKPTDLSLSVEIDTSEGIGSSIKKIGIGELGIKSFSISPKEITCDFKEVAPEAE